NDVGVGDEAPGGVGGLRAGGAGLDPAAQQGEVVVGGARRLFFGRHLALDESLQQFRLVRFAGHDLAAGDGAVAVEDVVHAALGGAVAAVAAVAVRFEDGTGLDGQVGFGRGRTGGTQEGEADQVQCGLHVGLQDGRRDDADGSGQTDSSSDGG